MHPWHATCVQESPS